MLIKIPDTSGLETTTVLNTKIKSEIPNNSKYITTQQFNKFST